MRRIFCRGAWQCTPAVRQIFAGIFLLLCVPLFSPALAQDITTYLSLQTDAAAVQTGQYYEVRIQVDGAVDLWLVSAEIDYDPEMLYIAGTKSGLPVQRGALFSPADSIDVLNQVEDSQVIYTASQLAPAQTLSGSGVAGSFRVYPLKAGNTTLSFRQGEL